MLYCIEVNRRGIGEENCILHVSFDKEPTKEDIVTYINSEDIGYNPQYCKFDYYRVD